MATERNPLADELRREMAEHRGGIVRYISQRDEKLQRFMLGIRDDLVGEIQKVDRKISDPQAWAETTAIRNFRAENFGAIEKRAKRAESTRNIAVAVAGGIAVLSPAIAHLLDALAHYLLGR